MTKRFVPRSRAFVRFGYDLDPLAINCIKFAIFGGHGYLRCPSPLRTRCPELSYCKFLLLRTYGVGYPGLICNFFKARSAHAAMHQPTLRSRQRAVVPRLYTKLPSTKSIHLLRSPYSLTSPRFPSPIRQATKYELTKDSSMSRLETGDWRSEKPAKVSLLVAL
jgi:hypothetical protein